MSEHRGRRSRIVALPEAATLLDLTVDGVRALVEAGYLRSVDEVPTFARGDLKAFVARNADDGAGILLDDAGEGDPRALLALLDQRSEDMAQRVYEIFAAAFPDAAEWGDAERDRFIDQARTRFEAILAVTAQGAEIDDALVTDLQDVGAAAAGTGSPLPQLLMVLRISRDLVVQTAIEVVEERGRHWGLALSLLLTRVLPAIDRLTDSVAQGYWAAVVQREDEERQRYAAVVEHSSDGIFEAGVDGRVCFANPSLAAILGRPPAELDDVAVTDLLPEAELVDRPEQSEVEVARPDGVARVLDIRTRPLQDEGMVVGWLGMVRVVPSELDLR